MKDLLYKEYRLALHPTSIIFLALASMIMIPSYPYFIVFFYLCLGVFFICITGRENKDIHYSMFLPVRKKEIVKARILMVVSLEIAQVILSIVFAALHNAAFTENNAAGMNPNTAFFGFALIMLGVFNFVFFTNYYKDTSKVGIPFLLGCIALTAVIFVAEASAHILPALNTKDPANLAEKLVVLAVGILAYVIFTFAACRKSVKSFEAMDL